MSDLIWLSEAQMRRIEPHFPLSHGVQIFLVGQDVRGRYCVCENHGVIGGAFASRADAVRFARDEARAIAHSIVLVTPVVISIDAIACASDALPRRLESLAA